MRSDDMPALERVRAANELAGLGDPRFRSDAWMLPDDQLLGFVRIPAGPFAMGGEGPDDDFDSEEHRCVLGDYFISRWPVTLAQFDAFQEEREKCLRGWQTYHEGDGPHHPVVSVTWPQAMAYCQWLEGKLQESWPVLPYELRKGFVHLAGSKGWRVVLPSEAEWEKAARSSDRRPYPWGFHFDEDCANVAERTLASEWITEERVTTEIGGTSPVGCYPRGTSPFGVEELLGNVAEWTRSTYKAYPFDPTDRSRDLRFSDPNDLLSRCVVRGRGYSLGCETVMARIAYPNMPFDDVGFRVAVVQIE
jgi:formylglycine-generating enzyme required for sulfatase activity